MKLGRYQNHTGSPLDPANGGNYHFDFSADAARRSVERSRERLGVDRLDAFFIHNLDRHFAKDANSELFDSALNGA